MSTDSRGGEKSAQTKYFIVIREGVPKVLGSWEM